MRAGVRARVWRAAHGILTVGLLTLYKWRPRSGVIAHPRAAQPTRSTPLASHFMRHFVRAALPSLPSSSAAARAAHHIIDGLLIHPLVQVGLDDRHLAESCVVVACCLSPSRPGRAEARGAPQRRAAPLLWVRCCTSYGGAAATRGLRCFAPCVALAIGSAREGPPRRSAAAAGNPSAHLHRAVAACKGLANARFHPSRRAWCRVVIARPQKPSCSRRSSRAAPPARGTSDGHPRRGREPRLVLVAGAQHPLGRGAAQPRPRLQHVRVVRQELRPVTHRHEARHLLLEQLVQLRLCVHARAHAYTTRRPQRIAARSAAQRERAPTAEPPAHPWRCPARSWPRPERPAPGGAAAAGAPPRAAARPTTAWTTSPARRPARPPAHAGGAHVAARPGLTP